MARFEGENDKLATEKSAYEVIDEEPMPVKPIIESNRNLHETNLLDFDSHANSNTLPNATSPDYGINGVSNVNDMVGGGGGSGGGRIFAQALGETTPNRWRADILFRGTADCFVDLNPSHTVISLVVAAAIVVVSVLALLLKKRTNYRRRDTSGQIGILGTGGEHGASAHSHVGVQTRSIRERRVRTGAAQAEAPALSPGALLSPSSNFRRSPHAQTSPLRGLRGGSAGSVAPFGVDFRAVQTAEIERERSRVKQMNQRRKAKREAAATAKGSSSSTPSRGRQAQARGSNNRNYRGISPAAGQGKRKAPAQFTLAKDTSSSGKEKASRQKPAGSSGAEPESRPGSTLVKHGSASRTTVPLEYGGPAMKSVAVAPKELKSKTPARRLLAMPTRSNPRSPSLGQRRLESSNKGSAVAATVGSGDTIGGVESSSPSTPSKRGASSVVETVRREAQLETNSAAKARAEKLNDDDGGDGHRKSTKRAKEETGEGDNGNKRGAKRANIPTRAGQGNDGLRRSTRHCDKQSDDGRSDGNDGGKTSTKSADRRTTEGESKGKEDSGTKRGTKRGSDSDETSSKYPKRARKH